MKYEVYLKKLKGCFTGKTVGGTLGMPMEGYIGVKKVEYYNPVPTEMVANDDLDLQVVWAEVISSCGLPVNRRELADGWLKHMRGLPDEYGVVMRNLKCGLYPPLSGSYDNNFGAGMGGAIRSEIWAAMAPCDPALAAKLALEDCCCDHYGDGVDAEVFLAALESAAYGESELEKLVDTALGFIPSGSRLSEMLRATQSWYGEYGDPIKVRDLIMHTYYAQNWTDVGINLSFILTGWLDGEKETDIRAKVTRALCSAVGLGNDGDCTGATLGSILGIIYPDGFEERWTKPLGDELVLSSCIASMHEGRTIDGFCRKIAGMCADAEEYYDSKTRVEGVPEHKKLSIRAKSDRYISLSNIKYNRRESLVTLRPYTIKLIYPENIALAPGESGVFEALISEPQGGAVNGKAEITASEGWEVKPSLFEINGEKGEKHISFTVTAPKEVNRRTAISELYFDFTADSLTFRATAGLAATYPLKRRALQWLSDECPDRALFDEAERLNVPAHSITLPDGAQLYSFEARSPSIISEAIMVAQAPRPVRVWMDGRLILSHDGSECSPAFHRTENVARLALDGEWKRFVIAVSERADRSTNVTPHNAYARVEGCPSHFEQRKEYDSSFGKDEKGELVIGFANRSGYEWLYELEWR